MMPNISNEGNSGKEAAAKEALKLVETEMIIGLGTGSTAKIFVDLLAQKYFEESLNIEVLATSSSTANQAQKLGLPLTSINNVERVDLVVDGADEVDPLLNLIKGGGGALLQEKIVAESSKVMVV
ncbi:MAG: ribose 5-phosphate isomerase A, partial [Pseudomonadota bacterium]|nr:ribose 5-phosphate isomerase A [Pseudomonadota bacterium]